MSGWTLLIVRDMLIGIRINDRRRTFWLVVEPGDASVCYTDPRLEVDAVPPDQRELVG